MDFAGDGSQDRHDQIAMHSCVYPAPSQMAIVLIIRISTHELDVITDKHGNFDTLSVEDGGLVAILWTAARYVIMIAPYGVFTIVIVGVLMMKEPEEILGNEPPTATSMDRASLALMSTTLLVTAALWPLRTRAQERVHHV